MERSNRSFYSKILSVFFRICTVSAADGANSEYVFLLMLSDIEPQKRGDLISPFFVGYRETKRKNEMFNN